MTRRIRRARAEDASALAGLSDMLGYPCDVAEMAARLARLDAMPNHVVLVVVDADGASQGWIHAFESAQLTSSAFVEIAGLVIDERSRGEGLGRLLVEGVAAWAGQRGIDRLRVHSRTCRDGAHRFYEHLGFTRSKTQHVFQCEGSVASRAGGRTEDVLMRNREGDMEER